MSVSPVYTAHGSATGGRDGQAKVAGTDLVLDLAPPTEMGGDGKGYNPEQLFAAKLFRLLHRRDEICDHAG